MIHKHYVDVKNIRNNTGLVDTYFVSKYHFSPYQACQHSCKYCDGRSEKYYVQGDFETDIVIRKNIADVLDTSLSKFREKGIIGISSGVSDPYQPVEIKEQLMSKCAAVISKHQYPAMLFTKSNMIMRDIDLWEEVHKNAGFTLMMSNVYPDDTHRKHFEPYASSVDARLKTLKAFKERGMSVGVLMMPILPYISDDQNAVVEMVKKYEEVGVDVVMPGGLTLRPGINKKTYFEVIQAHYPHLLQKYQYLYGENRQSGAPRNNYMKQKHLMYQKIIRGHNIPYEIPHHMYKHRLPIYDEIYVLMSHMLKIYSELNVNVDALALARKYYTEWLMHEKKYYARRRNLSYNEIESKVLYMLDSGEMMDYFKNEKLLSFFKQVILEDKVFDYLTRKLK